MVHQVIVELEQESALLEYMVKGLLPLLNSLLLLKHRSLLFEDVLFGRRLVEFFDLGLRQLFGSGKVARLDRARLFLATIF